MEHIILGLLLLQDRTIYELQSRIQKGLHLMYSSSTGSIQAALKKLLRCGDICYQELSENGRQKKVYSITESGKVHFREWVNSPMETQRTKNPELAKLYFMGFADKEDRTACIQKHLDFLQKQYLALTLICEDAENTKIPESGREIAYYQLATARYGRDFMKFNMEWYENLLKEMEK